MTRRTMSIILVILFAFSMLTGCSSTTKSPAASPDTSKNESSASSGTENKGATKDLNIAHIYFFAGAAAEARAEAGFEKYLKETHPTWKVTNYDANGDPQKFINLAQNAIQNKVDVLYISYANMRATKEVVVDANKAGIPIFTLDSGWVPGVVADIAANPYRDSAVMSSYFLDKIGGSGNFLIFGLDPIDPTRKRLEVLHTILKENPAYKVLAEHQVDHTNFMEDTQKTMENYLTQYGDQIDAVWCAYDEAAMAVADVIKARNMKKDIFVIGFDGNTQVIERMAAGKQPIAATMASPFETYGSTIANLIQKIVVEKQPADKVLTTRQIYLDSPLITVDNMPKSGTMAYASPDFYSLIMDEINK